MFVLNEFVLNEFVLKEWKNIFPEAVYCFGCLTGVLSISPGSKTVG